MGATAEVEIECERVGDQSAVVRLRSSGPMRAVAVVPRGPSAHVVTTALGAGHLSGDQVRLRVTVRPGASLVLATQATTRVMRDARGVRIETTAEVGAGGTLLSLPSPTAVYGGAVLEQLTRVAVEDESCSLWLRDSVVSGRVGERWQMDRLHSEIRVTCGGTLTFRDATRLDKELPGSREALEGHELVGVALATGPRMVQVAAALAALDEEGLAPCDVENGCAVRVVAHRAEIWDAIEQLVFRNLGETFDVDAFSGGR